MSRSANLPSLALPGVLLLFVSAALAQERARIGAPLAFERNRGQFAEQVHYAARGPGMTLLLTETGNAVTVRRPGASATVTMELAGAAGKAAVEASQPRPGVVNYLLGRDPSRWRTGIPTSGRVSYRDVWPGIDLVYHGERGRLEYDFVVAPGVDPDNVRMRFRGARSMRENDAGDLVFDTAAGELVHEAPFAYQEIGGERRRVAARFALHDDGTVGFAVGEYDEELPLVIDPVLVVASYFGGSGAEQDVRVATDAQGAFYIVGYTSSANLPTVAAFQASPAGGGAELFVAKYDPDGTTLVYATYLGGSSSEFPGGIAVLPGGSAAVTGYTQSSNFPVMNPFQTVYPGGGSACIVAVLSPSGAGLTYSTYYGGAGGCQGWDIAASGGTLYVTGNTGTIGLPGTSTGFQSTKGNAGVSGFVASFDPGLGGPSSLLGATYYRGNLSNQVVEPFAIAAGPAGVAIAGRSAADDLPMQNAFQSANAGGRDAFLAVFDAGLTSLNYATYAGGSGNDCFTSRGHLPIGLDQDPQGRIVLVTSTFSNDYPVTGNALVATGSGETGVVTRVDPANAGASLDYSTYIGGSGNDAVFDVAIDADGDMHLTGYVQSNDFPFVHQLQPTNLGVFSDVLIAVLDESGQSLRFASPVGGNGHDYGQSIALTPGGRTLVAGTTTVSNFPVTANAVQSTSGGAADGFVIAVDVHKASTELYGAGLAGTLGVPSIAMPQDPVLGAAVSVDIGNSLGASTLALLLFGFQETAIPVLSGTVLVGNPITVLLVLGPAGGSLPVNVPASTSFCGATFRFQLLESDPGAVEGVSFTRGLRMHIGV